MKSPIKRDWRGHNDAATSGRQRFGSEPLKFLLDPISQRPVVGPIAAVSINKSDMNLPFFVGRRGRAQDNVIGPTLHDVIMERDVPMAILRLIAFDHLFSMGVGHPLGRRNVG